MYAYVFRDGNYESMNFLLAYHDSNNSTFTFNYSPADFGNYYFDFYLNDPNQGVPQLLCNATFDYEDPNLNPDPVTAFTYTVIKTDSQIQVNINGYYVLDFGTKPILGGSMYANVYCDGDYVNVLDLLSYHGSNSSIFTFDYAPFDFGNYSFDFYLYDPNHATPQLLCNATLEYINPNPDPDPVTEFNYSITKNESRIQVSINGYYAIVHGNEPIYGGSMYVYIYRDGSYIDAIDLLTTHNLYDSTFTFDYSPTYFGNYSFDFYLNDPNLATPQLICNATFEYRNPNNNNTDPTPDPDPSDPDLDDLYEGDAMVTLPLAFGMVGAATMPLLGSYKMVRSKKIKNKQTSKNN